MNYEEEKAAAVKKIIPSLVLSIAGFLVFFMFIGTGNFFSRLGMGLIGALLLGGAVWGLYLTKTWFYPMGLVHSASQRTTMDASGFAKSMKGFLWVLTATIVGPFVMIAGYAKVIILFSRGKKAPVSADVSTEPSDTSKVENE